MTEPVTSKALVYLDRNHLEPELIPLLSGWTAVFSRRSPLKDTVNEDAAIVVPVDEQSGVIAVADGCGGMSGGANASRIAVETLRKAIQSGSTAGSSLRSAILDGIEKANRVVRELGTGSATTLAVAEIDRDTVRTYHVGDSTVLLVGNRGKIKLQTRSHAPVAYAVEAGVISEEEAIHHEDRHLVSNVVGTHDTHIEIGPRRKMSSRDTLLVASDGLFDNLQIDEIVQIIRKGPLARAAQQLADCARQRMEAFDSDHPCKPDDLTFVLYRERQ
jgi:serine/threonine protein phosphatase PrpC